MVQKNKAGMRVVCVCVCGVVFVVEIAGWGFGLAWMRKCEQRKGKKHDKEKQIRRKKDNDKWAKNKKSADKDKGD